MPPPEFFFVAYIQILLNEDSNLDYNNPCLPIQFYQDSILK